MLLKLFLLLFLISSSAMGLDMRDTSDILKRMHQKSSTLKKGDNGKLKKVSTLSKNENIDAKINTAKTNTIENKNKAKFDSEFIWKKDTKRHITKKQYAKVLKEFVELKYPQEVLGHNKVKEEQKAKKKEEKAKKAKQRAKKQQKLREKARLKKEKAKKEKAKKQKILAKKQKKLEKKKQAQQNKAKKEKVKQKKKLIAEEKTQRKKMALIEARVETIKKVNLKISKTEKSKQVKVKVKNVKVLKMKRDGDFVIAPNRLMWQDDVNVKTRTTWNDAIKYCENLSIGIYDDWRLPVKSELGSILDISKNPTINQKFKNVKASSYWTGSDYKNSKYYAWILHFDSGAFGSYSKKKSSLVRCVRDVK